MTVEERDARTVFCMQLSQRIRARDLEEFFSAVGKVTDFTIALILISVRPLSVMYASTTNFFLRYYQVRDVRLITCNKTRRFKGLCYVEFAEPESVPLVSWLHGKKFYRYIYLFVCCRRSH
jgi:RNA-binding protein 39